MGGNNKTEVAGWGEIVIFSGEDGTVRAQVDTVQDMLQVKKRIWVK